MANNPETKLIRLGLSAAMASALVAAGLTTPKLIKAAKANELKAAVGEKHLKVVETRFKIDRA